MTARRVTADPLLTPGQVAKVFRVDTKTVARWARKGLLPAVVTLGGHRRYRESLILELAQARIEKPAEDPE